jgi:hypothetical protein
MTTILVSGAIANKPFNGGNAWACLNYVFGFRKLGFDVYFLESMQPASCTADNRNYFKKIVRESSLDGKVALISPDLQTLEGIPFPELLAITESADLLVNISGHLNIEALTRRIRRKAYIDLDPGFTQFWHADDTCDFRVAGHDYYFTVGENIGTPDCLIPMDGIQWRRTRQPVVLDYWPVSKEGDPSRFTTIATWRGPFGPMTYGERIFGSKVREFRKYAGIPRQANGTFEIALNIHPADHRDREMLLQNSWQLVDPLQVVPDTSSFRRYIQTSGAEFSVAQQMYVDTKSGWFSDRTVRYLASGKPVLVQDTGFTRNYPVGDGLLAFSTPGEAVAGANKITDNYSAHAAAARRIAEEYFDSNRVLGELLDQIGVGA